MCERDVSRTGWMSKMHQLIDIPIRLKKIYSDQLYVAQADAEGHDTFNHQILVSDSREPDQGPY